jgi:hypothetical protein
VENLAKLDRYKWCGHSVIMNRYQNQWQDRRYVLKWFGREKTRFDRRWFNPIHGGVVNCKSHEIQRQ